MSRIASSPASATGGFFVNVTDNSEESDFLDEGRQGYAVFGQVVQGMEVVDAIAAVASNEMQNPVVPVLIQRVTRWQ
jgi:cyclophilin family peptidyl-prolyl cis-trans isomerase